MAVTTEGAHHRFDRLVVAVGARPFEAEARVLAARAAERAGDETAASTHSDRARELLRDLGARARLSELEP